MIHPTYPKAVCGVCRGAVQSIFGICPGLLLDQNAPDTLGQPRSTLGQEPLTTQDNLRSTRDDLQCGSGKVARTTPAIRGHIEPTPANPGGTEPLNNAVGGGEVARVPDGGQGRFVRKTREKPTKPSPPCYLFLVAGRGDRLPFRWIWIFLFASPRLCARLHASDALLLPR
jgi:hypothetical protein